MFGASPPHAYRVEVSESADAEADAIYLWLGQNRSPEAADRWYRQLTEAYQTLAQFPYRHAPLSHRPNVRRLLYGVYRVLYMTIELEVSDGEGIVRILHVYHGAQQPATLEEGENGGNENNDKETRQ